MTEPLNTTLRFSVAGRASAVLVLLFFVGEVLAGNSPIADAAEKSDE